VIDNGELPDLQRFRQKGGSPLVSKSWGQTVPVPYPYGYHPYSTGKRPL
jgi:hypothetical protein